MKNRLFFTSILSTFLFFNSASAQTVAEYMEQNVRSTPIHIIDSENPTGFLNSQVIYLADQLDRNLDTNFYTKPILITSFLNLDDLKRSSPLGRFMSESLMNQLQIRRYKVIDARLVKDIVMDRNGEYALSRNIKKIRTDYDISAIATGTYAVTDYGIIVNVKIIEADTGVVMASAQTSLPISGLEGMLYDYGRKQKIKIVGNPATNQIMISRNTTETNNISMDKKERKDGDKDGVVDSLDECPKTPEGFRVDEKGCKISFIFDAKFEFNSFKLTVESAVSIQKFANFLNDNPNYRSEIQGHTDNIGSDSYNRILSRKRAKSVYDSLLNLGIKTSQITYRGYGESQPMTTNSTSKGRATNRRVEAKLISD